MLLPRRIPLLCAAALAFGACDNKIESSVDDAKLAQVNTVLDCFPDLFRWVKGLLDIANTWRLNGGASDPAGVTWIYNSGTKNFEVDLTTGGSTVHMDIGGYDSDGAMLDVVSALSATGSPASLSSAIAEAAGFLRSNSSGEPFLVGVWSIAGGNIAASGEGLTGVIANSGSAAKLVQVFTSSTAVSGGVPAIESSVVNETSTGCTLTFNTPSPGLTTDESGQVEPSGTVTITLVGPEATVDATIVFTSVGGSTIAHLTVSGIDGTFDYDMASREISFNANN